MKRRFQLLAIALLACTATFAQVEKIVGDWTTVDDNSGKKVSIVRIYKENGAYFGKIIKLLDPSANPKSLGEMVIRDMKEKKGHLAGGRVYDPKSGNTYYGTVKYNADKNTLTLRGSIDKFGMLGRSQTWVK